MTDTELPGEAASGGDAPKAPPLDPKLVRAVARALCRVDGKPGPDFKPRWAEKKEDYLAQGRKLLRALGKEKVTLGVSEEPAPADATALKRM